MACFLPRRRLRPAGGGPAGVRRRLHDHAPYYQVMDNCLRAELEANGEVLLTRDALAGHEGFTILASGESDGQIENAMPVMEDLLRQALEADVLMALNDPSAFGGLAAIEGAGVASACRPDVVLMDVRMPGMGGRTAGGGAPPEAGG